MVFFERAKAKCEIRKIMQSGNLTIVLVLSPTSCVHSLQSMYCLFEFAGWTVLIGLLRLKRKDWTMSMAATWSVVLHG